MVIEAILRDSASVLLLETVFCFFGRPRNYVVPKIDTIPCCGFPIIYVSSPISIGETMNGLVGGGSKLNTKSTCACNVPKKPFYYFPVVDLRIMHVLRNFVDSVRNVWTGES